MRDNRDDDNDRGGLRYRYCVIVGRHSKMEMVVLLNGAIVSHNPRRSAINSMHTRHHFNRSVNTSLLLNVELNVTSAGYFYQLLPAASRYFIYQNFIRGK